MSTNTRKDSLAQQFASKLERVQIILNEKPSMQLHQQHE
jgi:hypothetical protein